MFDISLIRFIPKDTKVPFIKLRLVAAIISVLAIIGSIFLFATKNLNYGIDFTGGTVWEFHLDDDPTNDQIEEIRAIGNSLGLGSIQLQTIGQADDPNGKIQALRLAIEKQPAAEGEDNDDLAQQKALSTVRDAVSARFPSAGVTENTLSVQVLGTKVSGELRTKGALAVGLALIMVLIYIWVRFEWQFGLGAVAALFHDVIITIGMFSLTQMEFNLSIVAAILTIVGYSLNDTVIVYDRIRENLRKFKKMALPDVLNLSINDTLSRTIMTSCTTILALFALYTLGGEGLRGFAFAMIWGIFIGTYSSIFVASPLLMLFKLRQNTEQA